MKNVPGVELSDLTTHSGSSSQLIGSEASSSAISLPSDQSFIKSTSENPASEESFSTTNSPVKSARNKNSDDKVSKARELERAKRFIEKLSLTEQDLATVNLTLEELAAFFNSRNRLLKKITKPLHRIYWDNFITKLLTLMVYDRNHLKSLQSEVILKYGPDVDKKSESAIANDKHMSSLLPLPTWPKSRGLLLDSAVRLSLVFAATDFYKGTVLVAEKLFPLIFYSFTINEIVNYFNNRSRAAIDSYEAFKVILGQSDRTQSVAALIGTPYIALPVFLAPFAFGALKGAFALSQGRALSDKKIEAAIETLNQYPAEYPAEFSKKLAWLLTDTIRWLIPMHPLGRAQRRIERATAFDGRLTQAQRLAMLEAILAYAEKAHLMSQAKVMYVLADIGNAISLQDFKYLENAGYDKTIIAAALASKVKAKSFLRMMGDNYHLPDATAPSTPKERTLSYLSPLPRFVYANYLLWYFGEASKLYLQPFFWGYEVFRAYGIVSLLVTLVRGVVALIEQAATKAQCLADGKIWSYIPEISAENCTVCYSAEWKVPYKESWTDESCVNWFIKTPRTADELLRAIDYFDFSQINNITLSYHRLNNTGTSLVLDALRQKAPALSYFRPAKPNNETSIALGRFYNNITIDYLDLNNLQITDAEAAGIAYSFTQAKNISQLNLSFNSFTPVGCEILMPSIPQSVIYLDIGWNYIQDDGAIVVSKNLLRLPNLTSLKVRGNAIGPEGAKALAYALPGTPIEYYDISYNPSPGTTWPIPGTVGVNAITDVLNKTNIKQLDISSTGLAYDNVGPLFKILPSTKIWRFRIRFSPDIGDQGIALLAQVLPNTQITDLDLYKVGMTITGMRSFSEPFKKSKITQLFISNNQLNDDSAIILANSFPPSLQILIATTNNFGTPGIQAIFQKAPPSLWQLDLRLTQATSDSLVGIPPTLQFLRLGYNPNIQNAGAEVIANQLNKTSIYYLDLEATGITDIGGVTIAKALPQSKVLDLNLMHNGVTDVTADALSYALPKAPTQYLYLAGNGIGDNGAVSLASRLTKFIPSTRTFVWTEATAIAEDKKALALAQPNTNLSIVDLSYNPNITDEGAKVLYQVLPSTRIQCESLILMGTAVNQSLIDDCGFMDAITSSASTFYAPWPYGPLADSIIYSRDVLSNIYRHSRGNAVDVNTVMSLQLAGYLFIVGVFLTLARSMYSRFAANQGDATNDSQVQLEVSRKGSFHSEKQSSVTICGATLFARGSMSRTKLINHDSNAEFTRHNFTAKYTC